ncbi:MoaF-related domain-containing protein [Ensifer sp. B1-9]|uniref:MoaF-related domain-containing protein n=1 Tax=Ensifer sp. B1-9 TaxID=3141455 RepID=UPI003D1C2F64
MTDAFPHAGKRFEVDYGELVAINAYSSDGNTLNYEITSGPMAGVSGTVEYQWRRLGGETYAISWQEADGSTVVHVDDFQAGRSLSFFTTRQGQFFRLEGSLGQSPEL